LPLNIQSFNTLRKNNFIYADKTEIIFQIAKKPGFYFLSRPRRFGKSLLVSTLTSLFEGRQYLFKNLTEKFVILMNGIVKR